MTTSQRPSLDKETARRTLEQTLRRLGVRKGELAAALSMAASSFSRKLAPHHPFDRFSAEEIGAIAAYLDLTPAERDALLACYGYGDRPPAPAPQAPTPARPPTNLPAALTSFLGRESERREVRELLGDTRLLTLTGLGGVGKTRLALAVAADVQDQAWVADGAWLVELAALADPALVPQAVAAALGVREAPGRPLRDTLIDFLCARRLLLLLDNCEHLVGACAELVAVLLAACPTLRVLATSRERLGVPGEVAWPVPPLSLPDTGAGVGTAPDPAAVVHESDAVRLFVERARAARPSFVLTPANAGAVVEVCRRLDGIPLAIELAAARLTVLTAEQLAARLEEGLRILAGGSRVAPSRQQTLQAALDWSHDLLAEPERRLLRRLSVFAGGFGLEAAEVVCGGDGLPEHAVLDLLSQLVDKSWLVVDGQGEELRYRLLEPVRQYARARLEAATDGNAHAQSEADGLRTRHLGWCLVLAEGAKKGLKGPHQQEWLARLAQELENIRAALGWCTTDGHAEAGLRLAAALERFWDITGRFGEGRDWLMSGLTLGGRVPAGVRARALPAAGLLAHRQGDYAAALSHYDEGLVLARELGEMHLVADALHGLALLAHIRADYATATTLFGQAQTAAHGAGDRWREAFALHGLGLVARAQADYPAARACFGDALARWRELGDRRQAAAALTMLGLVLSAQGDHLAAQAVLEDSLAIKQGLGNRADINISLANLGFVAYERGDYVAARDLYERSLALVQEMGDRRSIAQAISDLGRVATAQGDFAAARRMHEQALVLLRELGDKRTIAYALASLAIARRGQGELEAARALHEESLALARELGDRHHVARVLSNLGYVATRLGDGERATALLWESLGLWRALENRTGLVRCLQNLAELAVLYGRPEDAARLLGGAEAACEAAGTPVPTAIPAEYERTVAAVRAALGDGPFFAAWAQGRATSLDQAVEHAIQVLARGDERERLPAP